MFTETEILEELTAAFNDLPGLYFPAGRAQDVKYNFFPDLEHGYCVTAGSRIHVYADAARWALVFEKSGYQNRATTAEAELNYFGNCVDYPVEETPERNYITNTGRIVLIDAAEFERVENKEGGEMETFELIGADIKEIKVGDRLIAFDSDWRNYEKLGIQVRDYDNPKKLIGFEDFVRYVNETNAAVMAATEDDIKKQLPKDLAKIMTVNEFHYMSAYDKNIPPAGRETWQLLAKVLVTQDAVQWKPNLAPNNHWHNWESGNL
jgi:hypothetical protein